MDLDAFFNENPDMRDEGLSSYGTTPNFRSGFVALVGRPNAGKSTLINALMGSKVAITSPTSQTTRRSLSAVFSQDNFQIIFVDTPGLHKPHDMLGDKLNEQAIDALGDVDVVCMLIDSSAEFGRGDKWVIEQIKRSSAKKICVLSKTDKANQEQIDKQVELAKENIQWDGIISLSAKKKYHLNEFIDMIYEFLPLGPAWFPKDMSTDQSNEMMVAEFIREKILKDFRDEIPHSVGVQIEDMQYIGKKKLYKIYATIFVERESQRGIIVGKGASSIKKVGTEARADLEELLGRHVFLDLRVKVKKNWRRDENMIRRLGYME